MSEQPAKKDWYLEAAKEIVQDLVGGTPVDQAILDSEHNRTIAILKRYFATKANVASMLTMHLGEPTPCQKCGRTPRELASRRGAKRADIERPSAPTSTRG